MASHFMFHNNTATLNDLWYESHASIIKMICMDLKQPDKISELLEKYLGTKLKLKTPKDPNKPKRAKTAFMYYCDEHRSQLIEKQRKVGKIKIGEIAKTLGKNWKKLTAQKMKPYNTKAIADKERYNKAIAEYNEKMGL